MPQNTVRLFASRFFTNTEVVDINEILKFYNYLDLLEKMQKFCNFFV